MALGYGSEFHLLRWTGRHRNEFDKKVKDILSVDNISWLDFEFAKDAKIPDKEITGLSFLDRVENVDLFSIWEVEWPQRGNLMNWDLVGFTIDEKGLKTWILIEAKAHIRELNSECKAKSIISKEKISTALEKTAENFGIQINTNWISKYYQLANRIYILNLLKRYNVKAKLINIYFLGDKPDKNRITPQCESDWGKAITDMKNLLGIMSNTQMEIGIYDLFLNTNKLKEEDYGI